MEISGWVAPPLLIASIAGAQSRPRVDAVLTPAPVWFEEFTAAARVSPDGRWAAYTGDELRLYDLRTGRESREPIWPGLDVVRGISFGPTGEIFLRGVVGGKPGWYRKTAVVPERLSIPADADPRWFPDGSRVAYARRSVPDSVFAGALGRVRAYPIRGLLGGIGWSSSSDTLIILAADSSGASSLARLDLVSGRTKSDPRRIDAWPLFSPVAVDVSGGHAYVAAVTVANRLGLDNLTRQSPAAPRRMSIYELNLFDQRSIPIAQADTAADLLDPQIANGRLYWTRAESHTSIVTLPIAGGAAQTIVRDGAVPSWRPDGTQLGFFFGDWRVVDWAINWDAGAIAVDGAGRATGRPVPLITNYGEDFEPEWSPNGKWIAYHSHRSATPVPYYGAPGSTDDIWLRRPGHPPRDSADIRLTDFGFEAGSPSWSRHGDELVFGSYDRQGTPGINLLWLVRIDTITGRALSHARVPLPPGVASVSWAAWSPVADEIVIEGGAAKGTHALWIMSPSGTNARKVVEFPTETFSGVDWTPDGKTLIYAALAAGHMQVFAIAAVGGTARQLTHDAANLVHPRVSPNGRVVAATRIEHHKTLMSLPLRSAPASAGTRPYSEKK